jgi:hemolysin activation/secretion protein
MARIGRGRGFYREIRHWLVITGTLLSLSWGFWAIAQDQKKPPLPKAVDPEQVIRPSLPEYQPSEPTPQFKLPPVKPLPKDRLSSQVRVRVRKIALTGNTVFSDEELSQLTAPYENRIITTGELQELRYKLTLYYVNRGYINSGALIPDQRVVDGVIRIHIVEGKLAEINVSGNKRLRRGYINKRLLSDSENALNVKTVQERLQLLQQSELIDRVNAELSPGVKLGEAVLNVDVAEHTPWQLAFVVANNRPPSIGAIQGQVFAAYRNITGWGDSISGRYGLSDGADDFAVAYAVPLTASDTTLSLSYDRSDSSVIEEPFTALVIDSDLEVFRISVTHPFLRTLHRTLLLGLALDRRHSQTSLLGRPFSFSPGVIEGESDVTGLRFSQEWLDRGFKQVIAARSTLSWGIDAFGATNNPSNLPDGQFFTWFGQFQWARRFGKNNNQIIVRTDLQVAADPLLPLEQCAIGGADTVRGYRVNQLVRDNCFVASLEFRIPVFRLPIPGLSRGYEDGSVQLAPFADFGAAWNTESLTSDPPTLPSLGIGIRWDPSPMLHAELYWGYAFQDFVTVEHDLQDDGISFEVTSTLF